MRVLHPNKIFVGFLALILVGMFIAVPAGAQVAQPISDCTLGSDMNINIVVPDGAAFGAGEEDIVIVHEGADISSVAGSITGEVTDVHPTTGARVRGAVSSEQQTAIAQMWGTICLLNTINAITDWLFIFLIAGAVLAIVIAGFMYLTMGGNTARQGTATKLIMGAVIGIVIAMLARVIPTVVTGILT